MNEQKMTGYASIDKPWLKFYSEEAINAPLPQCSMYEYLSQKIKGREKFPAVDYFGAKLNYGELIKEIDRAAAAFHELGIRAGETVTICAITTPEIICAIYGLNKLGAICNIIEPRVNVEQIKRRVVEASSDVIVLCNVFYKKLSTIIDELELTAVIVPVIGSMPFGKKLAASLMRKNPKSRGITWRKLMKLGEGKDVKPFYEKDHIAAIIYTGGTTGIAKGVMLSDRAVNSVAQQLILGIDIKSDEKFLDIMPPFIAYGFACGLHMPLCAGVEVIIIPKFEPAKFASMIKKHRPTFFIGVPSHYEVLMKGGELDGVDLSFVNIAGMGGDALNKETEVEINEFFKQHNTNTAVDKGYGMTEMCSAASSTSPAINELGSVGVPLPHTVISIFEPSTDRELKYGESGEICITGPGMMHGYFGNSAETVNVIKKHADGLDWVHSQDIGYMTENGSLYVVGRIKRMLIRPDGHNVWPSQMESVICEHPGVLQCSVVGKKVEAGKNGVLPAAFVVSNKGFEHKKLREELVKLSLEKLPERDVAQYYYFVDELPLTPVGKVDYRRLEQLADEAKE